MPYHVNNHLLDRRLLARDIGERRRLASVVLRLLEGRGLLAFAAPDDHLHLLLQGSREEAGESMRIVEIGLQRNFRYGVPFTTPHFVEVQGRAQMERCFAYVLGQGGHHGVTADPLAEASSLPDLLGLRVLGAHTLPAVRGELPRLVRADLVRHLGVDDLDGPHAPEHLLDAAASAVGAQAPSAASMPEARAAAWHVGREMHIERYELARLLGVSPRSGRRMESANPPAPLVEAVRRQLAARGRLAPPPQSPTRPPLTLRRSRLAASTTAASTTERAAAPSGSP